MLTSKFVSGGRSLPHPSRVKPQLLATGPDQVFSWDITKLKGPSKGVYYSAYVMIDIYSRKIIHVEVHTREDKVLARDFIDAAIRANRGVLPRYIHSDNGGPMTSGHRRAAPVGAGYHQVVVATQGQ
ncbi:MAG: transposase family protein [Austwickia sp.]|nr:MAG: transposase family protein [Austwickia sp.]